jgi:DNA-binding response OmpR family regulator
MRILLVEDEHKIAAAIKRGLEQESYAVDVTYDADTGLSSALSEEYDVIVLDRMLPGLIEGVEITKEIRAEGIHTPILMLTAKGEIHDRVTGLNAGADDYLIRNQNRILTRDNIISHVWDYDADILPNTVEVYMGYLRNKIDKPFKGQNLIQTVRGFGYRLGVSSG